jgi:CheY-like chemotaxis protein
MIDDSVAEANLVKEALKEGRHEVEFNHINKSKAAMPYFNSLSTLPKSAKPDLIFLDLHMPGITGLEILGMMKSDDELKALPVIMFSTSKDSEEIRECYSGKANAFVTKPHEFEGYMNLMDNICDFWFGTVKLPVEQFVY